MSVNLLLVQPDPLVRAGLKSWLEGTEFRIVGEAVSRDQLLELSRGRQPRIVLTEARLPDGETFDVVSQLVRELPELAAIFFSAHDQATNVNRAHGAQARGFIPMTAGRQQVLDDLRTVASGKSLWSEDQMRRFRARRKGRLERGLDLPSLTPREVETLRYLTEGQTNRQIAKAMSVSTETVKEHVQNVLRKLGVRDRTQAALRAVREKWFEANELPEE